MKKNVKFLTKLKRQTRKWKYTLFVIGISTINGNFIYKFNVTPIKIPSVQHPNNRNFRRKEKKNDRGKKSKKNTICCAKIFKIERDFRILSNIKEEEKDPGQGICLRNCKTKVIKRKLLKTYRKGEKQVI